MPKTSKSPRRKGKNIPGFAAKERIDHSVFGLGTIVEINERHTTIVFDTNGTRKFVTSMVKMEHSDAPAPARSVRRAKKVGLSG